MKKHTKVLIQSLIASQGAIVGGKKRAEKVIADLLVKVATFVPTYEHPTLKNIPFTLLSLAQPELVDVTPSADQIKQALLYEDDLSGITFYLTNEGELTFAYLIRSLDLSTGSQYYDNRAEARAYSDAYRSGNEHRLEMAKETLRAKLPNKKLRYLHWIGIKPEISAINTFKSEHPEYFS